MRLRSLPSGSCGLLLLILICSSGCQTLGWSRVWQQVFTASWQPRPVGQEAVLRRVQQLQRLGRIDLALQELTAALAREPENPRLLNALGICYDILGEHRRAQEIFRQLLAVNPDDLRVRNNLGYSYLLAGEYQQAVCELQQVVTQDPANERARNNLGLALVYQGRYQEALALWEAREGGERARERLVQLAARLQLTVPAALLAKPAAGVPQPSPAAAEVAAAGEKAMTTAAENRPRRLEKNPGRQERFRQKSSEAAVALRAPRKLRDSCLDLHAEGPWEPHDPTKTMIF